MPARLPSIKASWATIEMQFDPPLAESGPSLQVLSLTSIQEEADLQHKTHLRGAAKVFKEPTLLIRILRDVRSQRRIFCNCIILSSL